MSNSLTISLKEILINPFLVCDFIFEEDKRTRLNESDLETLEEFFMFFLTEKNLAKLLKLFKDGHYESYFDLKHGKGEFKELIEFNVESVTPVLLIERAIINFFYGEDPLKYNAETFASGMASAYYEANQEDEEFVETIKSNITGHMRRLGF